MSSGSSRRKGRDTDPEQSVSSGKGKGVGSSRRWPQTLARRASSSSVTPDIASVWEASDLDEGDGDERKRVGVEIYIGVGKRKKKAMGPIRSSLGLHASRGSLKVPRFLST